MRAWSDSHAAFDAAFYSMRAGRAYVYMFTVTGHFRAKIKTQTATYSGAHYIMDDVTFYYVSPMILCET